MSFLLNLSIIGWYQWGRCRIVFFFNESYRSCKALSLLLDSCFWKGSHCECLCSMFEGSGGCLTQLHSFTQCPYAQSGIIIPFIWYSLGNAWLGKRSFRDLVWCIFFFFQKRRTPGSVTLLVLWSFWLEINCTFHNMFILADDIATNAWISLLFFSWATSNSLQGFWFLIFGPVTWMVILFYCSYLSLLTFFYFYSLVV